MSDYFVHLHVASGYSLRHGASHPHLLAARAAEHGMDALALTDRDGVYGAVRFAKACQQEGIRPVLGADLAVAPVTLSGELALPKDRRSPSTRPSPSPPGPARGGIFIDPGLPRVTLLAVGRPGWGALCRLVTATHLAGERGTPITSLELIAEHAESARAAGGALIVLMGPKSEAARALALRRGALAAAHVERWRSALPEPGELQFEVVHHRGRGELARAGRWAGFGAASGLPVVLTNEVRYADRSDAPVADVLDASRLLVALDARHVGRVNAEGYLKSGKEMGEIAEEVARAAGFTDGGRSLLIRSRQIAERCVLDPKADLGIGEIHFPELEVSGGGLAGADADLVLRARCEAGLVRRGMPASREVSERLDAELNIIRSLGYPSYFLTVADVVDLIREMGVRCAARGSGAGSLVTYLTGVSDVDPLRYGLLMERFLSPLRHQLPDVDIDVESARRTEVYEKVLARYGGERCACVAMMDTYRARHAIRDVGGALGLPPGEIDAVAKAFPHIRASQVRAAMRELPELRSSGLSAERLDLLLRLVERLDGLPRHIALHPCGVLLSDVTLLERTPVEASYLGFPMSQFDKDDVEDLGLLKLDLLGIRMQSAIAHAIAEVQRVDGVEVAIDEIDRADPTTFALVQSTRTLGCFQIESPGQRELVGKFAPETFEDVIIDISLFRPGPVKSDMVTPFLEARQGWREAHYLHPDLEPYLADTGGVVVFHEQVLQIVAHMTKISLAEADEARRALGDPDLQQEVRAAFVPAALRAGYDLATVERVWEVLKAFGSFGFCKAHAAAFALPTYQSAWLKAHHTAAFLAGVLTHDPGMYPKRLILDDARQFGIAILGLDVNESDSVYRVERVGTFSEPPPAVLDAPARHPPLDPRLPDARDYGIRMALAEVKGISSAEVESIVAGRPYGSLSDFWHRARASRPIVERLVLAGGFDSLYGIGMAAPVRRRGRITRRDLLLQVTELDRWSRAVARSSGRSTRRSRRVEGAGPGDGGDGGVGGVVAQAARQSQAPRGAGGEADQVQLALPLGDDPSAVRASGLPELTGAEQLRAELDVLGLDVTRHVVDFYEPFMAAMGITRSRDLVGCRSRQEVLIAGVKVATQTPPVRSGRRVVFVTLDDATGPLDATFFEDAQVGYASTVFHSWLLVIRGFVRRTGPRGVSLRATGCWELPAMRDAWELGGIPAAEQLMATRAEVSEFAVQGAAASRSSRPVMVNPPTGGPVGRAQQYATGFRLSPYADIKPSGGDARSAPRRLWHSSPGSSGG
jgi:error-prone DNA polymerase